MCGGAKDIVVLVAMEKMFRGPRPIAIILHSYIQLIELVWKFTVCTLCIVRLH